MIGLIEQGNCGYGSKTNALFVFFECASVGVFRFGEKPALSVLAHEIFHCVHAIMKRIGQRLTDDSEESYAYLTEYIFSEIIKNT